MSSSQYKNSMFAKNGHKCEIIFTNQQVALPQYEKNFLGRLKNKYVIMSMVSETNPRSTYYLKSQCIIEQERRKHLKYLYMIHPFSKMRIIWETTMILIYFMQFATIPFDLSKHVLTECPNFTPSLYWRWYRNALDFWCLLNMILNFFTGYYNFKNREVIINPKRVALHYLTTFFFIDLLSSFPTHVHVLIPFVENNFDLMYLHVFLYIKLLIFCRIGTFTSLQYNFSQNFKFSFTKYRIIYIVFIFLLYFHVSCCVLLYVLGKLLYVDRGGIYTYDNQEKIVITKGYLHALYQTTMIICSAGYGILKITYELKIFVMVLWAISKIFYIFLLAKMMEIVMSRTASSHKYVEMVRQLKEYMRHKQLPEYMQKRLLNYYEFRFQKSYFRENEILNTISGQLRQELIMHSCKNLVENVGFFKNLPITLLIRIVSCLKSEIYLVNDVIIKANTLGDCMYFISTGTVAIYTKSGREVCHLEDGSYFGEISLVLNDQLRTASVIAVEICELYRLDRRDFTRAVYPYPDLLNNIKHIAADRMERTGILDEHNRREMASKRIN